MRNLSLDHVGFIVRDLELSAMRWEQLGFKLSRRSQQMGHVPGGAKMAPWATSNHCAMFQEGYLELIGVTNPSFYNPWSKFIDRFEGPHITALRCDNADAAFETLSKRIDLFDPPIQRLRNAPYGDEEVPFRFRNIFSQDEKCPEGRYIVIEHQTPEVIWQDDLMMHPNGAKALIELIFCATEAEGTFDRLVCFTGGKFTSVSNGRKIFLEPGCFSLIDKEEFSRIYPGAPSPQHPAVVGVMIRVESLTQTTELILGNGVDIKSSNRGSFWVMPEHANGAVIEFVQ